MNKLMLMPAAVLVLWTLVVLVWLARVRFGHLARAGISPATATPGTRGGDLEGQVPPPVMWPSHNYTHLTEQPTLFYAVVAIIAIAGPGRIDIALAWAYVALRVVHSLWQIRVNTLPTRILLFRLMTYVLLALGLRALWVCVA